AAKAVTLFPLPKGSNFGLRFGPFRGRLLCLKGRSHGLLEILFRFRAFSVFGLRLFPRMNKPSEYITDLFHKLREDISAIKHRLFTEKPRVESSENRRHYVIDAVHKGDIRNEENTQAIRATLNLPPTIHIDAQTEERQKPWHKDRTVILQIFGIFVGTVVAIIYMCQLNAMLEANKLSQQAFSVSQRSYVAIGRKDGVIGNFVTSKDAKQNAWMVIYFQNSGHQPAQFTWGAFGPNFMENAQGQTSSGLEFTNPFRDMFRTRDKKTGSEGQEGSSFTISSESVFVAKLAEISNANLANLESKNIGEMIGGIYHYCDAMGTDVEHEFHIGFHNAPDPSLNFYLIDDMEWIGQRPTADSATTKYLPPCKTLEEK